MFNNIIVQGMTFPALLKNEQMQRKSVGLLQIKRIAQLSDIRLLQKFSSSF